MKTQKTLSLAVLTLALAACGGSGGGGDGQPPLPANTAGKNVEGRIDSNIGWGVGSGLSGKDINKVKIDGRDVELMPSGMSRNGNWLSNGENGRSSRIIGAFLTNARIGVLTSRSNIYILAQGYVTPAENVPTQGLVRYLGEHVFVSKNKPFSGAEYNSSIGGIGFEMNFADKTMVGAIELPSSVSSDGKRGYVGFRGEIEGNRIYTTSEGNPLSLRGQFYGENAEEVAGTYSHIDRSQFDKAFSGAFGAKKQN